MSNENKEEIKKIDLYDKLVDTFKKCLKSEVQQLLKECKEEILQTTENIKLLKKENETMFNDCHEMAKMLKEKYKL